MVIGVSRVTSQGQISVPADVRRKLGIGPGSILEWDEDDEKVVVRRAGRFTSEDLHLAAFHGEKPKARTIGQMKEGIRRRMSERYAHP